MKVKVTEQGLTIPKKWLEGIQEVEVRIETHQIVLVPTVVIPSKVVPTVEPDPIWQLGSNPISLETPDASENHDKYLYGMDG